MVAHLVIDPKNNDNETFHFSSVPVYIKMGGIT